MGHVEVAHVSHVLPDGRQLLDDASFKIPDGATAAIVGPNGSGKTTLLQTGLEAYQGTVLAVTHDRWFAASFDGFLVFAPDGTVKESPTPVWD